MVGSDVAGFRIVDALPTRSIAQLYLARREGDDRDYVVKMISEAAIGDRYERASRLLEPIEHPNLVPIVATAREGSRFLVVTPYYPDGDLERLVRRVGPLPLDHLVAVLGQIAAALDALHAAGIVHRDVKPANILLDRDAAFLADPGLARLIRSDTSITTTGQFVGTIDYVAPEVLRGEPADARTDVYGLAAVAYMCLTGSVPFPRESEASVLFAHLTDPPPRVGHLGASVDAVLARGLAKSPAQRFGTCGELVSALREPERVPAAWVPPPPAAAAPSAPADWEEAPPARPPGTSITFVPALPERPAATSTTQVGERHAVHPARLPELLREAVPVGRTAEPQGELVDCSVFAPRAVARAATALVQVFLHLPDEAADAAAVASELDRDAERRGFRSLANPIERGEVLAIELTVPGLAVDDPVQVLRWSGRVESVQFALTVPPDFPRCSTVGTVTISRAGLPVGHVKFKVDVAIEGEDDSEPVARGDDARRYTRAFVSYSSVDRDEVLRRVQVLSALGISYFQDVLDLEPGQRWERELYRRIEEADVFLLFWSSAARASQWVRKEVDYALRHKRDDDLAPPEIRPVLVEGPPVPPPWPELAHLHFTDRTLYALDRTTMATEGRPALHLEPIVVARAGVVIGRDFALDDPLLSRRHALVAPLPDGTLQVEDLGSLNGTFVNDRRITAPTRLQAGDVIRVGGTSIRVR